MTLYSAAGQYRHHDDQAEQQTDARGMEVNTMAASIVIEEESGTYSGRVHPHNGYYAGDFTTRPYVEPTAWRSPVVTKQPATLLAR
jgi:hypothetical protein